MSVGGFTSGVKGLVKAAIPVGLGYVSVNLLNQYVWSPLFVKIGANTWGKTDTTQKLVNTGWSTVTSMITAGVGAGIAVKFLRRRDAAALFAAGVGLKWAQTMAAIWFPDFANKIGLSGAGDDGMADYVEYALPGPGVRDYVEAENGNSMADYVESY